MEAGKIPPRSCDWTVCAKEFNPVRKDQRFCSKPCRDSFYRAMGGADKPAAEPAEPKHRGRPKAVKPEAVQVAETPQSKEARLETLRKIQARVAARQDLGEAATRVFGEKPVEPG
jgi:hypothetical protein